MCSQAAQIQFWLLQCMVYKIIIVLWQQCILYLIKYNAWSNLTQEIIILQIFITLICGAFDKLYQKNARFSKIEIVFSMCYIRLSTVLRLLLLHPESQSTKKIWPTNDEIMMKFIIWNLWCNCCEDRFKMFSSNERLLGPRIWT